MYDYEHSFFKDITTLSLDNDIEWSALLSLVERVGISINIDKMYEELCALRKFRSELLRLTGDVSKHIGEVLCHSVARRYITVTSSVQFSSVQFFLFLLRHMNKITKC